MTVYPLVDFVGDTGHVRTDFVHIDWLVVDPPPIGEFDLQFLEFQTLITKSRLQKFTRQIFVLKFDLLIFMLSICINNMDQFPDYFNLISFETAHQQARRLRKLVYTLVTLAMEKNDDKVILPMSAYTDSVIHQIVKELCIGFPERVHVEIDDVFMAIQYSDPVLSNEYMIYLKQTIE